jgi:hypothetical protein
MQNPQQKTTRSSRNSSPHALAATAACAPVGRNTSAPLHTFELASSGATCSVWLIERGSALVQLDGTTERVWTPFKNIEELKNLTFTHPKAQTTASLRERLENYRRAERVSAFQAISFRSSPARMAAIEAELRARGVL